MFVLIENIFHPHMQGTVAIWENKQILLLGDLKHTLK